MITCELPVDLSTDRIHGRIREVLSSRHGMLVGELCQRIGVSQLELRSVLTDMIFRGELERLRPVGYNNDDHDFYTKARNEGHPWDD